MRQRPYAEARMRRTVRLGGHAIVLVSHPPQSRFQLLLLLLPTSLFCLRPFFDCGALGFDGGCPLFMLRFAFFERCLRLGDCLLSPLALLLPGGLFLPALAVTPPLLPLESQCGLAGCLVAGRAVRDISVLRPPRRSSLSF